MNIQLHYTEKGSGEPLILLHGNGESHEYFVHQMEVFSRHYRVLALDTRGHGASPRGKAPFSIRQFADDLWAFMEEMGIEKAHILGFSDGGNIAMRFALDHPERVEKLILNGANLDPRGVKASVQLPIVLGYKLASFFARWQPGARKNAEMLGLMVNEPHVAPEELQRLTMPVLVVVGTKDMIREKHSRLIYKNLPRADLVFVEGDHFIAAKCPEAFNRAVMGFLNRDAAKTEEKTGEFFV